MSIESCRDLVKSSDPDRYTATMAAPKETRASLFALYAFNIEVGNAAWSARDPMLGEIRLQYWHDQIEALFQGLAIDAHPVMHALRDADRINSLPKANFFKIINARRWDAHTEPFQDQAGLGVYLTDTSGMLMAMAAHILGMNDPHKNTIREFGAAAGLATFFVAVPELKARGHHPLPDENEAAIRALAQDALTKIQATRSKEMMGMALPTLLSASEADPILRSIVKDPSLVLKGTLVRAPFRKAWRRLWLETFGKW